MKCVARLLGLFILPFACVVESKEITEKNTDSLKQFYDIGMELRVDGEIISAPRIVLNAGGSGSIEVSSENVSYLIAVQTESSKIVSGTVVIPVAFDVKSDIANESRAINALVDLPLGQTVSLIGKTNFDAGVQLNASIELIDEARSW